MIDFESVRSGNNNGTLQYSVSPVSAMVMIALNVRGSGRIIEAECTPGVIVAEITGCGVTDKNTYTGTSSEIEMLWRTVLEAQRLKAVLAMLSEGGIPQQGDQKLTPYLRTPWGIPYLAILNTLGIPTHPALLAEPEPLDFAAALELAMETHNPVKALETLFA